MIYLDNNASTRLCDEAFDAMLPWLRDNWSNPSSTQHGCGRAAGQAVEAARSDLASVIGVDANQIVFTSGASESSALALLGARRAGVPPRRLFAARTEHLSVLTACQRSIDFGAGVSFVPTDSAGRVTTRSFSSCKLGPDCLISVQWVNNETGVINDIPEIARMSRDLGALLHIDAAQALGKLPVDLPIVGAEYVTLSAHKLHGPKGVGALVLSQDAELDPLWTGGAQEHGLRGGTHNVAGIVGFAAAAKTAQRKGPSVWVAMSGLRDLLEKTLQERTTGSIVVGGEAPRAPNTLMISWPGLDGRELLRRLDEVGVAASSASACSSGTDGGSHVLRAIGLAPEIIRGAVRFSLSRETTREEIDVASTLIEKAITMLKQ